MASTLISTPLSFTSMTLHPDLVVNGEPLPLLSNALWLQESADDIYREHQLPSPLNTMDEVDRMGIAYAHEMRNAIQDEVNMAERRYRQMLILTRVYYLHFIRAQDRLQHLQKDLEVVVDTALNDAPNPSSPNPDDDHKQESPPGQCTTICIIPATACTNI